MTYDASARSLPESTRATVRVGDRIRGRDGKLYTVETIESVEAREFAPTTLAITGARMGRRADGRQRRELHNF